MKNKEKIILGIDPGFADTGFGIISKENNKLKYITCGSIKTLKTKSFSKRLKELYKEINKIIQKYNPDIVAVEKLFFAKNVKTAIDVAQARGVILLAIENNKQEALEFTPLQIKQALTSSGNAHKRQVGLMVKTILNLNAVPKPDDAADALAVAITASFLNKQLIK